MGLGYWVPLINSQVDGSALTNSTTATSLLPGAAKHTLHAGYCDAPGRRFHIKAGGRISTVVTTPGTLTLDVRFGSVVVANGGAMTLSTSAKTNVTWELDIEMTVRAIGASTSANIITIGRWTSEAAGATTVAGEAKSICFPQSAPAVGTGFDSTAAQIVDLFATWSVANASNSITCHYYDLSSN